jgi:hypothetical protein
MSQSPAVRLPLFGVFTSRRKLRGVGKDQSMKCPRCWAEKAYLRPLPAWKMALLSCLLLVPLKCQHCFHKFTVFWFFTWGKKIDPPRLKIIPIDQGGGPSVAAQHYQASKAQQAGEPAHTSPELSSQT